MKNIIFYFCLVSLISCSSDDNPSSNDFFNPPSWIRGEWLIDSQTQLNSGFKFSMDDFITISPFQEISHKELLSMSATSTISVDEIITDTVYEFDIMIDATTIKYEFKLIDSDHIEWVNDNNPTSQTIYERQ